VTDLDKDRENNFRYGVKDQFNFEFFDLRREFPRFQAITKPSFQDREYDFNLVTLMTGGQIERLGACRSAPNIRLRFLVLTGMRE
jgi:hypothetical protein